MKWSRWHSHSMNAILALPLFIAGQANAATAGTNSIPWFLSMENIGRTTTIAVAAIMAAICVCLAPFVLAPATFRLGRRCIRLIRKWHRSLNYPLAALVLLLIAAPHAHAAVAGAAGQQMPWDAFVGNVAADFSGPIAKAVATIMVVGTFLMIGAAKREIIHISHDMLIMAISVAGAVSAAAFIGIIVTGAVV